MAEAIINDQYLTDIAEAIRNKIGTIEKYLPSEMAEAIRSISAGSGGTDDTFQRLAIGLTDVSIDLGTATSVPSGVVPEKVAHVTGLEVTKVEDFAFTNENSNNTSTNYHTKYKLKDFNFPKLTTIGKYAFSCDEDLTSIELPDTVTTIGVCAFRWCIKAAAFHLPDGVKAVPDYCFYECINLEINALPDSIETIGTYAFSVCKKLSISGLPAGVKKIGDYAFSESSLSGEIAIGRGVSVGQYAFQNCTGITKAVLPEDMDSIPGSLFSGCTALAEVSIPGAVKIIYSYAFRNCSSLTAIEFPDTLEQVYGYAFYNCKLLNFTTFPKSLKTLYNYAFYGCLALTSITFQEKPEKTSSISSSAFSNCTNLLDIYVPWKEGEYSNAPWGATKATVHYETKFDVHTLSLEVPSMITSTVGSTAQCTLTFDTNYPKDDQAAMNWELTAGSEYASIDENGLITMTALAPDATVITVKVTSKYNADLTETKSLQAFNCGFEVELNDGQFVDSGTQVDGHTVYKSDAKSYHIDNGISRAKVTIWGYSSFTVMARSYGENNYDYLEIGPLDAENITRDSSTHVLTLKGKYSSSTYTKYTFENISSGRHSFEIIYSKDSSQSSYDDRGYFYIPDQG